ncbi:50S ribosomal protein L11 methyltransferase [Geobacter sp. SVR]|uniref:50S ribosomal protein L11 methyltransferase n=1 Tax=Geobacter sp. SVR TaxID=2495594 RepID=UPI00143EFF57|nr:50S ribosomal protein L11 methyltransferase [Geobacter sp. SVR]BCS55357.1 ribosomal protein L11 methyltransferase [Geobacter sp. SVR]GCF87282.1 ribosomal protein L11 methyltransferase [Geobacter sp. SVR]
MSDSWIEITCEISAELADILADYLAELSGTGVCTENLNVDAFSHSEIVHAPTVAVKAYFSANDDIEARMREIGSFLDHLAVQHPGLAITPPSRSTVRSEDWSTSWKANFKPLRVGRRLLVVPTWEDIHPRPDDIVLRLDPGMAFGTGGHETTKLCLEILEETMDTMPTLLSPSVLDLGTGSGILAMAAVKLGAGRVCAVDIDPLAIDVARENLTLNQLSDQVECSTTPLEALDGAFDVILANILAEELVRLAPHLTEHLAPGGRLVLSGILAEKEMLVRSGFAQQPVEYSETRRQGEWVALVYRKAHP